MRVLIYSLNFSPELTGIGKYSGEMAEWLSSHGHDIRVVTSFPYYPDWKVDSRYESKSWHIEHQYGIKIYRCPLWVPLRPSGFNRLIHLLTFALSSAPAMIMQVFWRPQVVWVVEPALLCAPMALITALLSRAKSWLHIQDFEVDAAFSMGLLKNKLLRGVALSIESFLMRRFNIVTSISVKMNEKILQKGVSKRRIKSFLNWVDVDLFDGIRTDDESGQIGSKVLNIRNSSEGEFVNFRDVLGIPYDSIVALYSGSMGGKQGLNILADIANICAEATPLDPLSKVIFVFCGNGSGHIELVSQCKFLKNVYFLDLQPADLLPSLLMMADIHLLPQIENAADLVMPSKLTGMMASARAVVTTASKGTELANLVCNFGIVVPPNDLHAFISALRELSINPSKRLGFGAAGYSYAKANLDKKIVLGKFESDLSYLINECL